MGLATDADDAQGQVASLCGLALLVVDDDPPRATDLARRAVTLGTGMGHVGALTTSGWVALARGDHAQAQQWAHQATAEASARLDRTGEAEALTLHAAASETTTAHQQGQRAVALWTELQDPIGAARAALVLADHQPHTAARTTLEAIQVRMRAAGCPLLETRAEAALARLDPAPDTSVRIETLGGFRVVRDGQAVPSSAWRSRKARDALKILIARRGRAITREALMDLLWPDETPEQIGSRLNVLLSTIRGILDPDRSMSPDGPLIGDGDALRLDLTQVNIDVERFLADATTGLRLLNEHQTHEALQHLDQAETRYTGDFLEGASAPRRENPWRVGRRRSMLKQAPMAPTSQEVVMTELKTWTAEIVLEETPDKTDARVTLRMGDAECVAEGHARRNPDDPNIPRIGEELATARALSELSGKLLEESARILEVRIGHRVELQA